MAVPLLDATDPQRRTHPVAKSSHNNGGAAAASVVVTTKKSPKDTIRTVIGRKPPSTYYESFPKTIRTLVLTSVVAYLLHLGKLWDSHFWLSTAIVSMTLELYSSSWHRFLSYLYPLMLAISTKTWISPMQALMVIPIAVPLVAIPMSVCLHRYSAHGAFETSRPMQLVIGIVACFAYQGGPIWWAGKHGKHHHHCDQELDPHSWIVSGFFYSLVGFTFDPNGVKNLDLEYIPKALLTPEMFVLDRIYMLPVFGLFSVLENQYTILRSDICYGLLFPMLACRMLTLAFNLSFHPPSKYQRCRSIDMNSHPIAILVGEAAHEVHHRKPTQSKRSDADMGYWLTIFWMEKLGLVWNVR